MTGPNDNDIPAEGEGNAPADEPQKVGYGNPPVPTRFQPGKSGNPRGRPKGARGLRAELKAELDEFVTVEVNGKKKRIRKRRLVIKALAAQAAKGNVSAADKLLALVIQAEGFEDQRPDKQKLSDTDLKILERFMTGAAPSKTEVTAKPEPGYDNNPDA